MNILLCRVNIVLFLAQPRIKYLAFPSHLGHCPLPEWFGLLLLQGGYTQRRYGVTPCRMKQCRKGGFDLDQVPTLQSKEVSLNSLICSSVCPNEGCVFNYHQLQP